MPAALALAQLADDVARALSSYAAALRRGGVHPPVTAPPSGAVTPTVATRPTVLGERQQRLLALPGLDSVDGLSNREIAEQLGIKIPNATAVTKRLSELGRLEPVPDEAPVRYRRAAAASKPMRPPGRKVPPTPQ